MAAGGHFGCPKITFGRISGHFRSIRNFFLIFFYKMAAVGHFGCPKFTLDHISGYFRSIPNFYFFLIFFYKMAAGRPFWMSENHFGSHFWPFQINTNFFFWKFLTKWLPSAILDVRNSLWITFLAILDRYSNFFYNLEIFDKMADVGHFGCPNFTFDRISGHFRSIRNFNFF